MKLGCKEAFEGIRLKEGGPFGAVIVKDGKVVASAHNQVLLTQDPTAHAEIQAIRKASNILGRFDLSDCEIYSTCEPCPMCFSAIHWAKIKKLYYGCTAEDAKNIGFDDELIYNVIRGKEVGPVVVETLDREKCLFLFEKWLEISDKTLY